MSHCSGVMNLVTENMNIFKHANMQRELPNRKVYAFAIKHGLFKLNITDHHAVLGVSLDAKPKEIRLRYLKIAQKLHPDKCRSDEARMKVAGQILSKLVNPAYEQLSRKNAFAEHQLILTQVGKRIAENKDKVTVKSSQAQELLEAGNSGDDFGGGRALLLEFKGIGPALDDTKHAKKVHVLIVHEASVSITDSGVQVSS